MRIGVVCEGQTDGPAITNFLKASLTDRGITPVFVPIQPENDGTKPPDGGCYEVLNWLRKNPPKSRIANYLSGGLFDDGLSTKRCDVLIFQMDSTPAARRAAPCRYRRGISAARQRRNACS